MTKDGEPGTYAIRVNGLLIPDIETLHKFLRSIDRPRYIELHLERGRAASIVLLNAERAVLLIFSDDGKQSCSSRDPEDHGTGDDVVEFVLANGQKDAYERAWTIPFDTALPAIDHFLITGEKAPWIHWYQDV